MEWKNMKEVVLITGGNGDVAQAIAQVLNKSCVVYTPSKEELDVTHEHNIRTYFEMVKPDILINNAGYIYPQSIEHLTSYELHKQLDVNLIGAIICSREAINNGVKLIINIGSSAGIKGKASWSAYCVSKAGLIMFNECLNAEGINSMILNIGRTDTKMRSKLFPDEDKSTLLTPKEVADEVYKLIYLSNFTEYKKYFLLKISS
jgi:NAD(P)-dependent dehydrogenase (short-subunit alcohol dehydrogenase family)